MRSPWVAAVLLVGCSGAPTSFVVYDLTARPDSGADKAAEISSDAGASRVAESSSDQGDSAPAAVDKTPDTSADTGAAPAPSSTATPSPTTPSSPAPEAGASYPSPPTSAACMSGMRLVAGGVYQTPADGGPGMVCDCVPDQVDGAFACATPRTVFPRCVVFGPQQYPCSTVGSGGWCEYRWACP